MTRARKSPEAPPVKRCAIYARKSKATSDGEVFSSLDAQREACEQYIGSQREQGWEASPNQYNDDGFTGANVERPGFQRLLDDVDAGRVDVVVVYKLDRLSRSLLDFVSIMARLKKVGCEFVSVTQHFSTTDAIGRLTLNMLMSFAEFEREMISERTRDKIAASRKKGLWSGGAVPPGYDVIDRRLVKNDLRALVVEEAFDLYITHRSALDVARILNERGRMTKLHKARSGRVRGPRPWTKQSVLRLLRTPYVAGLVPYRDELYPGEHEAIIAESRWRRVQALLDQHRKQQKSRARNLDYILRGRLFCGHCGLAFTPGPTQKNGRTYRYYRCVTRDKRGRDACPSMPLPADKIETYVVDVIRETAMNEPFIRAVRSRAHEYAARRRAELGRERLAIPTQIAQLSAEGRELTTRACGASASASGFLDERLDQVGAEIRRLEQRQRDVADELAAVEHVEAEIEWIASTLPQFTTVWDAMNQRNRFRLVQALIRSVVVNEQAGTVALEFAEPELDGGRADSEVGEATAHEDGDEPAAPDSGPSLRLVELDEDE